MTTQGNDSMAGGTSNGLDKSKGAPHTLMGQAKSVAGEAYSTVADKAATTIEERKSGLTEELTRVAQTVRRFSGTLTEDADQTAVTEYATRYSDTAAQKLEDVASYFDRSDLRSVATDLESYAKRNPAIFLGAAFGIGVIAARFFKSSPQPSAGAGQSIGGGDRGALSPATRDNTMNATDAS